MGKENFSDYAPYDLQPGVRKKNNAIIILTGLLVLALIVLGSSMNSSKDTQSKSTTSPKSETSAPAVIEGSSECSSIRTDITMIRTSFSQATDTPQEVSWLLEAAGNDFRQAASSFSGSKADWLNKMSQLTKKISSFILQGSPADGPQALDQLYANMDLVDQFCD